MEFIFVLTIILFQILFINLIKVVEVAGTFRIHAFVDNKVFSVFLVNQRVIAVRAFQGVGLRKTVFYRRECGGADLAQKLPF